MSTFSPNKSLELPASGSYQNDWNVPLNSDFSLLDTCLGGVASISVTAVAGPVTDLTLAQYQPINIVFSGVLSNALQYNVPANIGGVWTVANYTSGSYSLVMGSDGGGTSVTLPQGQRSFVVSDGTNIALAQSLNIPFSELSGTILPGQVTSTAVTQYQNILAIAVSQLTGTISAGQIGFLPASQTNSGVFATARIPPPASLPGVTIQADPGGTPTGVYGDVFYYY